MVDQTVNDEQLTVGGDDAAPSTRAPRLSCPALSAGFGDCRPDL